MTSGVPDNAVLLSCPQCGAPLALPAYADLAVCGSCGSTLTRGLRETPDSDGQRRPEEQVLRSMRCSQCAGTLSVREGNRVIVCGHCGVRFVAREQDGSTRWYFPCRVDRLQAAAAGATWLSEYPGISRKARDARFVEARLTYAPIWEHRALSAGWEFGYKVRTRNETVQDPTDESRIRLELQTVREGVKESRLQERRFYQAATDFGAMGATRPRVTGRELLVPLLAGELDPGATVQPAQMSATEVAEKGRRAALQPLSGALSPDSHLFVFRESTALLYYPLWSVRFEQGGRSCRLVVDGRDGSVNAASAPAAEGRQLLGMAARLTPLAIVVAALIVFAVTRDTARAAVVAAAVIVSVVAAILVGRYRTKEEVEYHEPFSS